MKTEEFVRQLEDVIDEYEGMIARSQHKDLSDLPKHDRQALVTKTVAAIGRIAGPRSTYGSDLERIRKDMPALHVHTSSVMGVAMALLNDLEEGFIDSVVEMAHADVFSDFLEMAEHLKETGYKDASAVIAGSALEVHLRALCQKNAIDTDAAKQDGSRLAKKADTLNAELATKLVYGKLDQKSITAWLDLRNKAAHGKYGEYESEQVSLTIAGIRDFIGRNPA